ncbi:phosphatidylinositol kinase related TOR-like 1 [Trypanosoma rangeli SC58]|uniref:non-specific serine/threonine protein kinase n=1 Tax=Trypanosoma rangeli SC58 TaxID=429131 RepID=A0A061IVX4_TRYRA|nr:phosphatidylinositol kinase related TOR-like 1 [Trypanosoma rangeli SC58]
MTNAVEHSTDRFFKESASALGRQFSVIFRNLQSAPPSRLRRVNECLADLLDLLVAHPKEIAELGLLDYIFQLVNETFDDSYEKGLQALRVVFDANIGDQHEKRSRCVALLMKQAARGKSEEDCAAVLQDLGEVLQENVRSTSDMLGKHLNRAIVMMRQGTSLHERAVGCQILATMVATSSGVIKRNPALLDSLNASCSPLFLLRETLESAFSWHRHALVSLLTSVVEKHCIEVPASMVTQMSAMMTECIETADEEGRILGLLTTIETVAASPTLQSAPWPLKAIHSFLTGRDWKTTTVEARNIVPRATGKALFLFRNDEELYDGVMRCLLSYIAEWDQTVAGTALSTLYDILNDVNIAPHGDLAVNAVCDYIVKFCFGQLPFDVLRRLLAQCEEQSLTRIYALFDRIEIDTEYANLPKLGALLGFMEEHGLEAWQRFRQLQIDISSHVTVDVLVNVLPFLAKLGRTEQMTRMIELMFHEDLRVRRAAVDAVVTLCEKLISQTEDDGSAPQPIQRLNNTVMGAVGKLLDVAVADRDAELRYTVLCRLSAPFDLYLSLQDHLDALLMARNDVSRNARDRTLVLLCRLHPCNPAIVHSQLLCQQEYMLREIEAKDGSTSATIYHASLLQMSAEHDTLLLPPRTVELAVLERLWRQPFICKSFSIALLNLLRVILDRTGPHAHCDANQLLQPVLNIINGSTSSRRRKAALETLCSILTTITVTKQPSYVGIYLALARIIRSEAEEDEEVNYAAMKALSVIGAVNPTRLRLVLKALEEDEIEEAEEVATSALARYKPRMRVSQHMTERYPSVVLYLLVKTLQQSADPEQQADTIATISCMMREIPGNQKAILLTHFLPQLQTWLADPERDHLYEGILLLMTELATLLRCFRDVISFNTGSELLHSVRLFCLLPQASQKPLNSGVVELLDEVARGLSAQEMRDHRWAVEFIHQRVSQDKSDLDLVLRAVKSLESFLAVLHEKDLQSVLPHVLQCIEPEDEAPSALRPKTKDINAACFDFLNQIMVKQPSLVKDCCAEIVHTVMWYIEHSNSQDEIEMGFNTLAFLVDAVNRQAKRFIVPIQHIAEQKGFSDDMFLGLLDLAARGLLKVRAPSTKRDKLNPELPLSVVSHLPGLSRKDFEEEMLNTLHLSRDKFEVMDVTHPSGQTIINLRFCGGEELATTFRFFTRKAQETQSVLRRNLGILKLDQTPLNECKVDVALLQKIATIPVANRKKREQSWIAWLHKTSVEMLANSPIQPLRCTAELAKYNSDLSRDLFPFAAAAFIAPLDNAQRALVMNTFTRALEMSPNDIKQILFCFAEFFESERGKNKMTLVKRTETITCVVERDNVEKRFGINYDQSTRGIVVTRLEPNAPGARAGVPVGALLVAINGKKVSAVSEIVSIIRGVSKIELQLNCEVEERRRPEAKPLMDLEVLARVAFDSQMHAKAIYLNEVLFDQLFSELGEQVSCRQDAAVRAALQVAERLIEFYDHLGLNMVAKGLVKKMSAKFSGNIIAPEQSGFDEVGALEQLNWWGEALVRYESRMFNTDGSINISSLLGVLRCLDALGETIEMEVIINKNWPQLDRESRADVAPLKAKVALALGRWQQFDELTGESGVLERLDMVERCATLFRQHRYEELLRFTKEHRESLFDAFSESFMESYNRAYDMLVELQHLCHFEELVSFVNSGSERRCMLKELWQRRLAQMSSRPAHVRTLITINSLVLSPSSDLASQVMCINALSKAQWTSFADHMLKLLLGPAGDYQALCSQDPDVIHAYMKHCYATKSRRETLRLISDILMRLQVAPGDERAEAWGCCWLLLGEWTMHLFPDKGDEAIEELRKATELCPKNHLAFHSLGILHYDMSRDPSTPLDVQTRHYVSSITALFKSVELSSNQGNGVMEDVLRILSIWFSHSTLLEINEVIKEGIDRVPDYVWLKVIPQLVARIGITAKAARSILTELLVRVGSKYPHALIYPLTVTEKSPEAIRQLMAERVLRGIRVSNGPMVGEASLISNEMVRIAILWAEKWHSHIQQAAAKQTDASAILRILNPLYWELDNPLTPNECSFEKTYGPTLRHARVALQNNTLDQAWSLLKQVYVQLSKATGERRLLMEDLSPTLGSISKSIVAVPGSFVLGQPLITIQKFHQRVFVMSSKQKPRRLGLDASNGQKYRFLLKGHEDLRQDERVMQFIEFVNTIFLTDSSSSAIGLTIPQYAVIPLTDNVGIIGWVENTETIYRLLETRRKEHDISIYEEVHMIIRNGGLRNIEEYHQQSKENRKKILGDVINNTPDDELRRIIWDKNDTCEQWLEYRVTYGHTLAIMSMVGYVLGLGDRHLNNLMLQEKGSVVHIDFGDCFEVAMHRALYAEAVPFRLTRLLVTALGITGVDGVYRLTCELVMKNLRRHCENLLSILEAFIYDPLINWRLANVGDGDRPQSRTETAVKIEDNNPLGPEEANTQGPQMQLSFSVARVREFVADATVDQLNEEETRNLQGDLALARVRAKLTGEDFEVLNSSSLFHSSRHDVCDEFADGSSCDSQSYEDSQKDSFGMGNPVLTTYLSLRRVNGGANCLDVPHQVDRLIQEATSLDNLAEAYITGWAPFW